MTLLESARLGRMTPLIKKVAAYEGVSTRFLLRGIADGTIVIPLNKTRRISRPCAIGSGIRTKVNANVGTSTDKARLREEVKKIDVAVRYGADTVMDLSVGGDIQRVRKEVVRHSPVPVGTVPVYEIAVRAQKAKGDALAFTADEMLDALVAQARDGIDFFTIHCGTTRKSSAALKKHRRILDVVSRGGAILVSWMQLHKKENPFFEHFDAILDIARRYDITLSLGDGLRPGSIFDANDAAQFSELKILGELASRARRRGVQVMIEGPGHVRLDRIKENIVLQKKICRNAPFYVLGPLVTDVAAGYDHISASIGGALAASYGADFLCYVTASEHLRHPSLEDVREGVVAARIAAHAADLVKGIPSALRWDRAMSEARSRRDWKKQIELSIDPDKARSYRAASKPHMQDVCTMCGSYCSIKLMENCRKVKQ